MNYDTNNITFVDTFKNWAEILTGILCNAFLEMFIILVTFNIAAFYEDYYFERTSFPRPPMSMMNPLSRAKMPADTARA